MALTELPITRVLEWTGLRKGKYYQWVKRYGKVNEHNGKIPRDHWLTTEEKQAILDYHEDHPLNGYRRLTYMMLDADVVAVSPSSVYRVLRAASRLDRLKHRPSKKGTGFKQPSKPHDHWHIDISYINAGGTFYYLCSILDGCSRYIVDWDIGESMTEAAIERLIERAREKYPGVTPRIISDNGPQFVANDFKSYIRLVGMTHVRTSPYYPQSNGKIERWHKTMKKDSIRITPPKDLEDARRILHRFVEHYNNCRLHSAIGYLTPNDRLNNRHKAIRATRDTKLEASRTARAEKRQRYRAAARSPRCA